MQVDAPVERGTEQWGKRQNNMERREREKMTERDREAHGLGVFLSHIVPRKAGEPAMPL